MFNGSNENPSQDTPSDSSSSNPPPSQTPPDSSSSNPPPSQTPPDSSSSNPSPNQTPPASSSSNPPPDQTPSDSSSSNPPPNQTPSDSFSSLLSLFPPSSNIEVMQITGKVVIPDLEPTLNSQSITANSQIISHQQFNQLQTTSHTLTQVKIRHQGPDGSMIERDALLLRPIPTPGQNLAPGDSNPGIDPQSSVNNNNYNQAPSPELTGSNESSEKNVQQEASQPPVVFGSPSNTPTSLGNAGAAYNSNAFLTPPKGQKEQEQEQEQEETIENADGSSLKPNPGQKK